MPEVPWSWIPPEWSDPYGTGTPTPVPASDSNMIDYGSQQEAGVGDYYDSELGLVNGVTGQPVYPNSDRVQDTIKNTVRIAQTLGRPDTPPPEEGPLKERLIAQVAPPRSDVARIAQTPDVAAPGSPPLLGETPQLLTPPLLGSQEATPSLAPGSVAATDAFIQNATKTLPDEELTATQLGARWSELPPEEQERRRQEIENAKSEHQVARLTYEQLKDTQAAEEAARNRELAIQQNMMQTAALDAEAKSIANQDPLDDISVGRKIMAVIASVVGGLVTKQTGGRNVGLDAVDGMINDAVERQKVRLNQIGARRGALAEQYAKTGDLYRAGEAVRLAAWNMTIQKLETEMQQFDQRGTQVLRYMDTINQAKAQYAAHLQKYQQQDFENRIKAGEYGIKVADLKLRQNADQRAAAKAAGTGSGPKYLPEYYEALYGADGKPPLAMSEKEHAAWLGKRKSIKDLTKPATEKSEAQLRKEEAEATESEAKAEAAKTGFVLKNPETGQPILNPDNKPVVEMDATKRNQTSNIMEAATNIRRLADRMAALKKKYGGAIKALGSDEAAELQQLTSSIDFETFKAFGLGAPTEGDKGLAEGVRGGVDPTSFVKDATAGFQAYADSVEKKANTALRNSGYTGPAIRFHRASEQKKTEPSVVDHFGNLIAGAEYKPRDERRDPLSSLRLTAPQEDKANRKTEEAFFILEAYAEQPDDRGDQARKTLKELTTRAVSPAARAKAKAILDSLPGRHERTEGAR